MTMGNRDMAELWFAARPHIVKSLQNWVKREVFAIIIMLGWAGVVSSHSDLESLLPC